MNAEDSLAGSYPSLARSRIHSNHRIHQSKTSHQDWRMRNVLSSRSSSSWGGTVKELLVEVPHSRGVTNPYNNLIYQKLWGQTIQFGYLRTWWVIVLYLQPSWSIVANLLCTSIGCFYCFHSQGKRLLEADIWFCQCSKAYLFQSLASFVWRNWLLQAHSLGEEAFPLVWTSYRWAIISCNSHWIMPSVYFTTMAPVPRFAIFSW